MSLSLRNQGSSRLGLSAQCSLGRSSFGTGQGQNRNDRCNGNAALRLDTDWSVNLNGGQERTNVGTLAARNYDNYGASVLWTPSPRTRFELGADKRYFGNGHRLVLEHRTPRTIWRYSDVRDVNNGDTFGNGRSITLFQLFFAQFASIQPDPTLRDQLVRQYLAAIGRSPDELLNVSLPGGGTTVQRRRDLSVAWTGLRMTVTVLAYSSESRFLGGPNTGPSTASAGSNSSQSGGTVSSSYRLTPLTSLTAALSRSITPDAARTGSGTGLKAATLSLSTQLGARTTASLSGRYSVLNGGADPYREAALTATLSLRF